VNLSRSAVSRRIEVTGDCRGSVDWRDKPGGSKSTTAVDRMILVRDGNAYPGILREGLFMAIGGSIPPSEIQSEPGAYRAVFEIEVPASSRRVLTLACAVDSDARAATRKLAAVLQQENPILKNRGEWSQFFQNDVPRFSSSNRGLDELYAFRWFLLRFSTAGGNLGYFKHPVVLEGRAAYQTFCCYSAPFMAFDLNWAVDPQIGFGHIASMVSAAYDDGRFPWYTSPKSNRVPVHHASRTGLSLLPLAAWKFFQIHPDSPLLGEIYPGLKKKSRMVDSRARPRWRWIVRHRKSARNWHGRFAPLGRRRGASVRRRRRHELRLREFICAGGHGAATGQLPRR